MDMLVPEHVCCNIILGRGHAQNMAPGLIHLVPGLRLGLRGQALEVQLRTAPDTLEVFRAHEHVCLIYDKPALLPILFDESPDALWVANEGSLVGTVGKVQLRVDKAADVAAKESWPAEGEGAAATEAFTPPVEESGSQPGTQ